MAPPSRLPRAARRAQLVEAAAGAFLERGFAGTSMEDVAQAAGVSRLMVYRIFESKSELYRAVVDALIADLRAHFEGYTIAEVQQSGATRLMLPVARAHPDAFRLLWRHALHEPEFAEQAILLRGYVTHYAREILRTFVNDEVMLEWAARTAGAHLIEALCNWIDVGDPSRDEQFGDLMTHGLRALAASWVRSLER